MVRQYENRIQKSLEFLFQTLHCLFLISYFKLSQVIIILKFTFKFIPNSKERSLSVVSVVASLTCKSLPDDEM